MSAKAEARLVLANASGLFTGRALSEIYLGWADVLDGDLDGGIARDETPYVGVESRRLRVYQRPLFRPLLPPRWGVPDGSMRAFAPSTSRSCSSSEPDNGTTRRSCIGLRANCCWATTHRMPLRRSNHFTSALDIARKQRAKSWELRASNSLARLLRDSNRREEARSMLDEIYRSFTEGFDTADLKDARTLLDELNA